MSADAKAWTDNGSLWRACHDGDCLDADCDLTHTQGDTLSAQLASIERCMGCTLNWSIRAYPNGQFGLVGYVC